jgi:hypothetical protein
MRVGIANISREDRSELIKVMQERNTYVMWGSYIMSHLVNSMLGKQG